MATPKPKPKPKPAPAVLSSAPITKETLERFREAHRIVATGKDHEGRQYEPEGTLNQAAWIGEHAGVLLDEIERLKAALDEALKNPRLS